MKPVMSVVLLTLAVVPMACVVIEPRPYSCCGNQQPVLGFDPLCDHSWTNNGQTFASFGRAPEGCQAPCQELLSGNITLDKCTNHTTTVICRNQQGVAEEKRIVHVPLCTDANPLMTPAPIKTEQRHHYGVLLSVGCLLLLSLGIFCYVKRAASAAGGETSQAV